MDTYILRCCPAPWREDHPHGVALPRVARTAGHRRPRPPLLTWWSRKVNVHFRRFGPQVRHPPSVTVPFTRVCGQHLVDPTVLRLPSQAAQIADEEHQAISVAASGNQIFAST